MIDTSLFVASGDQLRSFTKVVDVAATPAQVFASWTQPAELSKYFGSKHNVDLEVGGRYEILFEHDGGTIGSNGCQVLGWVPDRMLCFSWNAPPMFAAERELRTWVTVLLEPGLDDGCRLELHHVGFGEGGNWDAVHDYFDAAWGRVLEGLVARFAS
jgi:uncharacterized protein YndB with AHSA1/START domain